MNKHTFAWESFAFGAFFLAIAGNWVAHRQDTFTFEQLGIAAPIALIALGIMGVVATMWRKK